jgi:serine/threonine-protein kinase
VIHDTRETLQAALGTGYASERELGGGGMSRVFVASETALDRRVLIKVLPPSSGMG